MSPTPTPGRVVLYVLPNDESIREHARGKIRPARVIGLTNDVLGIASYPIEGQVCQLMVDLDGTNDVDAKGLGMAEVLRQSWRTSVPHDQEGKAPGTWHWMEYQLGQAQKTEQIGSALLPRVEAVERQLAALNAKQPASQRLPVTDPTPKIADDLNMGHVATLGSFPLGATSAPKIAADSITVTPEGLRLAGTSEVAGVKSEGFDPPGAVAPTEGQTEH